MRFMVIFFLAFLTAVVNAHFQLQFPSPRGPFNAPDEVKFCDGYPNAASNRTLFPLSGGYITLKAGHPGWTSGVLISTSQNPTTFGEFALINGYAAEPKAGNFCLPLDFSKSNVTGLQSGQNVTLQVVFQGGDGNLYQCADVTLANNLNLASTVTCANVTATPSATAHSSSRISAQAKSISFVTALVALVGMLLL